MGEDKKELLIRRSLKRVRLCTQHSNSFSPKRMQWPITYTSNCLFRVCSLKSGGQIQIQNKLLIFPRGAAAPQILPVSGEGRTWTKGPQIWPLPPPWLQPSWLKDHRLSPPEWPLLFPCGLFYTLVVSQPVLTRCCEILKLQSDEAIPWPGDLQGSLLLK